MLYIVMKKCKQKRQALCLSFGADDETCRERSERNSERLCLHKGTSATHKTCEFMR